MRTLPIGQLNDWYSANRRQLPWRGADPWAVLVSEFMLQQTPVSRVLPVYRRWIQRWPGAALLATASPAEVLAEWGRLGYPRRARNLHRAAQSIVDRHGGEVPDQLVDLRALPGVGEYTARAVAVFGFGRRHGVVDVNVRRVLARVVLGVADAPPSRSHVSLVEERLPASPPDAAVASQALMELGALVCRRARPRCDACPLAASCAWRLSGASVAAVLPRRQARYEGSDRQARGALLAVLRSTGVLDRALARSAVPEPEQRRRCLQSLVDDGLVVKEGSVWRLPGHDDWANLTRVSG